jgi:hypothetical protein
MNSGQILKKYTSQLLQKKNVTMVGLGTKKVGGQDTGKQAIVVGVKKKVPLSTLAAGDIIPVQIKGLDTDVVETGEITLRDGTDAPDRTKRYRPAPGGVSIGNVIITAGTLGCIVYKDGKRLILSNNHVLAAVNEAAIGSVIVQPGTYDGGTPEKDAIGKLREFVEIKMVGASSCPIGNAGAKVLNFFARLFHSGTRLMPVGGLEGNLADCALAEANSDDDIIDRILEDDGMVAPVDEMEAEIDLNVKKSGRTTGTKHNKVSQMGVTANVNMGNGKIAIFTDQFAVEHTAEDPFSQPGDSGSAILSEDNKLVGLLFAGSDTITLCNKWSNVKALLNLD